MLAREELFAEYAAAIVSAREPGATDATAWSDPALFCAIRGQAGLVMTAWNPGFARPTKEINEANNARMFAALDETGFEIWAADCASPDGQFREPAFLVWDMPVDSGLVLASEFGQFAIFVYSAEGERTVVSC